MKEWEKHLERAEEKLSAANLLFENNMFADAISEAYYAMFHAAKSLLALKDIYPKTHTGVVSQFGLQFVNEGFIEELYGKSFAKAQTKREKADYDIYYEPSEEEAESILEDAENFLERIKRAVKELK
jgi:uncharacterized protein (UPF0332 family)